MLRRGVRAGLILIISLAFLLGPTYFAQSSSVTSKPAANEKAQAVKTDSHPRVRLGGIQVGAFYTHSHFSSPYFRCSPFFFDPLYCGGWPYFAAYPFYYPMSYYGGMSYYNGMLAYGQGGEVRVQTHLKDARVYLNDAYAGDIKHLKSFWLAPGVYEVELRQADQPVFHQRIYVLTGKTVTVNSSTQEGKGVEQ
ncbi:MAG: hypothetical protein PHX83_10840 [Acidobacteriia bacterium]|nr:hypothetical protein [Terriglobia bacterium]